jgi:hypothetical protein
MNPHPAGRQGYNPSSLVPLVQSLAEIESAFRASIPNEALRGLISTRVLLRTGVNLRMIDPQKDRNPEVVAHVLNTLADFGYRLEHG